MPRASLLLPAVIDRSWQQVWHPALGIPKQKFEFEIQKLPSDSVCP
jgi:hypothetical protein